MRIKTLTTKLPFAMVRIWLIALNWSTLVYTFKLRSSNHEFPTIISIQSPKIYPSDVLRPACPAEELITNLTVIRWASSKQATEAGAAGGACVWEYVRQMEKRERWVGVDRWRRLRTRQSLQIQTDLVSRSSAVGKIMSILMSFHWGDFRRQVYLICNLTNGVIITITDLYYVENSSLRSSIPAGWLTWQ